VLGMKVMRLFVRTHKNIGMLRQQVMQRGCSSLGLSDNKKIRDS